jgi:hypothetical protein
VDEAAKAVRVVDYKTGKFQWKAGELFRGGRELQLALYNRAAQALYPGHTVSEALYYHAVAKEKFKHRPVRRRQRWTGPSSGSCAPSTTPPAPASSPPWPTPATTAPSRAFAARREKRAREGRRTTPAFRLSSS